MSYKLYIEVTNPVLVELAVRVEPLLRLMQVELWLAQLLPVRLPQLLQLFLLPVLFQTLPLLLLHQQFLPETS